MADFYCCEQHMQGANVVIRLSQISGIMEGLDWRGDCGGLLGGSKPLSHMCGRDTGVWLAQ